jgi:hypothetical protein
MSGKAFSRPDVRVRPRPDTKGSLTAPQGAMPIFPAGDIWYTIQPGPEAATGTAPADARLTRE